MMDSSSLDIWDFSAGCVSGGHPSPEVAISEGW